MNRFSFFSSNLLPVFLIAVGAIGSASGQVVLSEDEPTTDLLVSQLTGDIFSTIFSEADVNENGVVGFSDISPFIAILTS